MFRVIEITFLMITPSAYSGCELQIHFTSYYEGSDAMYQFSLL